MWIINVLCLFVWTNSVSADIIDNACGTNLEEFRRYYNPSETLKVGENICQNQNEDCTGIIDRSAYTNITLATSSFADCSKYFSVKLDHPSPGEASLVLKESLSDIFDIEHITSIQNCKILYTCKNGNTTEHQANFNILPENDNAPKFWENNTATVNISKQFTPGLPIEFVHPELLIIAEDIDYTGGDEERGDNVIECIVEKDPSNLINCSTTLLDDQKRGVYKFSLSLKRSIGSDIPNPYDKGMPPLAGSNTQEVIISFEPTDEYPPIFDNVYYAANILNATWTSPETLVTIKAWDGDVDINNPIIYTIEEDSLVDICDNGNDCFTIDSSTGDFSWNNKLSDKIIRRGVIEVLVKATEDNNGLRRSSRTVVVIAIATPTSGCGSSALKFTAGSLDSKLFCYERGGVDVSTESIVIEAGTTCVYMSEGHMDKGFIIEMFCEGTVWQVNLGNIGN